MSNIDKLKEDIYSWLGDYECWFLDSEDPNVFCSDVEYMEACISDLLFDKSSKFLFIKTKPSEKYTIYDNMERIAVYEDGKGGILMYNASDLNRDDCIPEMYNYMTIDEFTNKYPEYIRVI